MSNVITWFELPTADFDRAVKFYSTILGKELTIIERMGQKRGVFPMDGEGVGGDLVPPGNGQFPSATGTRVSLNCEGHLDEVAGQVEAAGGHILQPKLSLGEPGWVVVISDTEGNTIGLHSKI
ncbi:VOC family protein [Patescibacteria group bacterium]|nr:VOC family protein [Patescibacteria group bacterium]